MSVVKHSRTHHSTQLMVNVNELKLPETEWWKLEITHLKLACERMTFIRH